jgi:hypothetical protein
VISFLKKH